MTDYYYHLVKCGCGYEWVIVSEEQRHVVTCEKCGMLHDIWVEDYLMAGTMDEVIAYLEEGVDQDVLDKF